jgi:gliding motility-associated-like protein
VVADGNGCTGADTVTVIQNANPVPSITGTTVFCAGSSTSLNAGAGFSQYQWSNSATTQTINVTTGGNYSVVVTNANGCTGSASVAVTMNSNPVPVITGPSSFCAGNPIILDAGTGYTSYNWSTGATAQTIPVSVAGTYTVVVYDANGCSGSVIKVVTQNPNLTPNITGPASLCLGDSIVLNAGGSYATYNWSTTESSQSITIHSGGTYSVIVTDANGCSGTDSILVTQSNNPSPTITGLLTVCIGDISVLDAGSGYTSYLWSTNATSQSINVTTSGIYSVTVTNAAGCSGSDTVIVDVVAALSVNAWPDTTIFLGESVQLHSSGAASWNWSPVEGLSCTTCPDPVANPQVTTTYTVIVIDSNGCPNMDIVTIIVDINCGTLFIPNIFSPNGDKANDVLYIRGNCIKTLTFFIYDRWGEKVFITKDPSEGWDGNFKGKQMDPGVFFYYLKAELLNNSEVNKKGTITLVR